MKRKLVIIYRPNINHLLSTSSTGSYEKFNFLSAQLGSSVNILSIPNCEIVTPDSNYGYLELGSAHFAHSTILLLLMK